MDNNTEIFAKIDTVLSGLREQQDLQKLAEKHGLNSRNAVKLTDDTIDNVLVGVIAQLLCKRSEDPRYNKLVTQGIRKRSLKTEIINDYKNQAIQLINQYKNMSKEEIQECYNVTNEPVVQEEKLSTDERKELSDDEFGIPEKRKFPLNDADHVEAAVRMFPYADASDKEALAKRILRKAHEFGMDTSGWDSINKYVVQEGMFDSIELAEIPYVTSSSGYKPVTVDESQMNPFALFDKIPINDYTVNRYKSRTDDMAIGLKHLRVNDNVRGFIWLNQQDEVVGYVAVEKQDIGPFIIALELSPKYQGKGLGKALLEFAENYLGGRYLSVSKKNTHAFEMYKKCGWVVYDETPYMYFMKKMTIQHNPKQQTPMYFYHMIDKNILLDDKGLKTPDYVLKVENNKRLYLKMTDKYRNRLVSPDGWNIYPGKNPDELTAEEIYDGINSFRGDSRGNNQIYMFRYPPTKELGPNMKAVLDTKDIYAFDINDPNNSKYINNINWGFDGSFTGNTPLSKDWYENISKEDYFSKYDDNGKMLFASLNHISIDPTLGYLPLSCLKKIDNGNNQ